jgi:hypothetical protein
MVFYLGYKHKLAGLLFSGLIYQSPAAAMKGKMLFIGC